MAREVENRKIIECLDAIERFKSDLFMDIYENLRLMRILLGRLDKKTEQYSLMKKLIENIQKLSDATKVPLINYELNLDTYAEFYLQAIKLRVICSLGNNDINDDNRDEYYRAVRLEIRNIKELAAITGDDNEKAKYEYIMQILNEEVNPTVNESLADTTAEDNKEILVPVIEETVSEGIPEIVKEEEPKVITEAVIEEPVIEPAKEPEPEPVLPQMDISEDTDINNIEETPSEKREAKKKIDILGSVKSKYQRTVEAIVKDKEDSFHPELTYDTYLKEESVLDSSISFSEYHPMYLVPGMFVMISRKGQVYLGHESNVLKSQYNNSNTDLICLTNADKSIYQMLSRNILEIDYVVDEDVRERVRNYGNFVDWLYKKLLKEGYVSINDLTSWKEYFGQVVDYIFYLELDQKERFYKAQKIADDVVEYAKLYDIAVPDRDALIGELNKGITTSTQATIDKIISDRLIRKSDSEEILRHLLDSLFYENYKKFISIARIRNDAELMKVDFDTWKAAFTK